jgi:hypothetical protein
MENQENSASFTAGDLHLLVTIADQLNPKNRRLAIKLVKVLKEQEDEGKK